MGSLPGHLMPGMMFLLIGIWHEIRLLQKYFFSQEKKVLFTSQIMQDNSFLCGRLKHIPFEGFTKLGLTVFALGFEINTVLSIDTGVDNAFAYGMHLSMYIFFGIAAVVDVLVFYKLNLPKDLDYFAYIMAFGMEGLLLNVHLGGRQDLDVSIHKLLVYVCFLTSLLCCLEAFLRHSVFVAFTRSFLVVLQGTWFCQVGFILYHPVLYAWESENHTHGMIATLIFSVHCAIVFLGMLATALCVGCFYKRGNSRNDESFFTKKTMNGQTEIPLIGETDSDIYD